MKIKREVLRKIIIIIPIIIGLLIVVFIISKAGFFDKKVDLESEMSTMVSSFYDKNIKGKIVGVHKQIVTLKDLQDQNYDIEEFINAKCTLESYSYVVLDNPKETDATKIKYTIENHLDCAEEK